MQAIGGPEVVRALILPNLRDYEGVVRDEIEGEGPKKAEAEMVIGAILTALGTLEEDGVRLTNGQTAKAGEEMRAKIVEKIGELFGSRVADLGRPRLVRAILEA